jgi:hypothetical protein
MSTRNRLDDPLDAVLHLLDRQVVDVDGAMVCKVDDLELTSWPDGALAVTGLLQGTPAVLPRLSGGSGAWLLERWRRLGVERDRRTTPRWIDLAVVERLGSDVRLHVRRDGLLVAQPEAEGGVVHHRLDHLLGLPVRGPGGDLGRVLDVRLVAQRHPGVRLACTHLVVGRGRPGSMLGYDRGADMGPVLVARAVRWLHRHSGQVALSAARIDWAAGRVETSQDALDRLTHASRGPGA